MRYLGVDYGRRRIGLALSDATGLLARAWRSLPGAGSPAGSAAAVAALVADPRDPLVDELAGVVIGLPRTLGGADTSATPEVRAFADALGGRLDRPVYLQDERLTSVEAESRLAATERDWRVRKAQLDAAAAAIILQDFLDGRPRDAAPETW